MKDTGIIMNYTVEYVEIENGKKPFEKFVLSLLINERAKVFETINYFIELTITLLNLKIRICRSRKASQNI